MIWGFSHYFRKPPYRYLFFPFCLEKPIFIANGCWGLFQMAVKGSLQKFGKSRGVVSRVLGAFESLVICLNPDGEAVPTMSSHLGHLKTRIFIYCTIKPSKNVGFGGSMVYTGYIQKDLGSWHPPTFFVLVMSAARFLKNKTSSENLLGKR